MFLYNIDRFLLFEEIKGLNPGFSAFIGFVDDLIIERHLSIVGEGGDLSFQDGNEIVGIFPGNIDELDHLFFD
jgi:hypothetical protein